MYAVITSSTDFASQCDLVETEADKFFSSTSVLENGISEDEPGHIDDSKQFTNMKLSMFYSLRQQEPPAIISGAFENALTASEERDKAIKKYGKPSDAIKTEVSTPPSTSELQPTSQQASSSNNSDAQEVKLSPAEQFMLQTFQSGQKQLLTSLQCSINTF